MEKKFKQKFDLKNLSHSILIVIFIIFFITYFNACGKKDEIQKSSDITKLKDSTVKQVVYTCPMHPEVRSMNKNDKCPKCGMKLVERKVR